MQRFVYRAAILNLMIASVFGQPARAGVSISFTTSDCRTHFSFTNGWSPVVVCPQPVPVFCRPGCQVFFPNGCGCSCGQVVYVPQAAITGWNVWSPMVVTSPPVVFTSPPSLYGFGSMSSTSNTSWWNQSTLRRGTSSVTTVTTTTRPDPKASPSSPGDTILIEKLDDRRILVTWNADSSKINSAVFCTGDLFKSPLESLRVSQPPFHAVLALNSSMRYVGATTMYNDGTQTTQWVPYSVLDR